MATSYVFTPMDEQLIYSTLPNRLLKLSEEKPDKNAFICYSANFTRQCSTRSELYQKSKLFAMGLVNMGIKPGDIVGIGLPNTLEWLVCHFGVIMAGGIALGLTFARQDGEDIRDCITTAANCVAVIFDSGESESKLFTIKKLISGTEKSGKIQYQQIKGLTFAIHCGSERSSDFPMTMDRVLQLGDANKVPLPSLNPDEICVVLTTSGTTGKSKLVPKTHFEMLNVIKTVNNIWDTQETDVYFNPSPFAWIGGYVLNYLLVGCTWVTVESMLSFGTVDAIVCFIIKIINLEKCNVCVLIAPCLYAMLDLKHEIGSQFPLKSVLVGGYPLRKSIAGVVGRITDRLVYIYGGSEFNSISNKVITHGTEFSDYNCGTPTRGMEVSIIDSAGKICFRNEIGTVYIRSRLRFRGYLNDVQQTEKVLNSSGWLCTDDAGYITDKGEIISLGRQTDFITVSGKLVSPYSVESMLAKHPDVSGVCIVPVPDEKTYQQMCACIIRKPGSSVSWESIADFFRGEMMENEDTLEMSRFCPGYHVFLESFPMTPTGKVIKNQLFSIAMEMLKLS